MNYCTNCGSELSHNQDVCMNCGFEVKNNKKQNSEISIPILIILIIFFWPAALIYAIVKSK